MRKYNIAGWVVGRKSFLLDLAEKLDTPLDTYRGIRGESQ